MQENCLKPSNNDRNDAVTAVKRFKFYQGHGMMVTATNSSRILPGAPGLGGTTGFLAPA